VFPAESRAVTTGWVASAVSVLPLKDGVVVTTSWVAAPEERVIEFEVAVIEPEVAVRV
jgi:hypothetical protein